MGLTQDWFLESGIWWKDAAFFLGRVVATSMEIGGVLFAVYGGCQ